MPRKRQLHTTSLPERRTDNGDIEIRDPGKPQFRVKGKWITLLEPLLKDPYRSKWCMVQTATSVEQATNTVENLKGRKVLMPEPEHDWSFAARGLEIFAIYRGPMKVQQTRTGSTRKLPSEPRKRKTTS